LEEEVVVLETDLDDCTGEELGYVLERLMISGARDVAVIPETRKKGRPGHLLKVVSDQREFRRIAEVVLTFWGLRGRKSPSVRWGMNSPLTETFLY
jgi:Uncharacterized conserved protein